MLISIPVVYTSWMDDVANVSEVRTASIFRVEICTMCELLFITVYNNLFRK
jgi:hypothetical protein